MLGPNVEHTFPGARSSYRRWKATGPIQLRPIASFNATCSWPSRRVSWLSRGMNMGTFGSTGYTFHRHHESMLHDQRKQTVFYGSCSHLPRATHDGTVLAECWEPVEAVSESVSHEDKSEEVVWPGTKYAIAFGYFVMDIRLSIPISWTWNYCWHSDSRVWEIVENKDGITVTLIICSILLVVCKALCNRVSPVVFTEPNGIRRNKIRL
jgi:hypothetical protein